MTLDAAIPIMLGFVIGHIIGQSIIAPVVVAYIRKRKK